MAEGRATPDVRVGARAVSIVDHARRHVSVETAYCDVPSQVRVSPLPLGTFTARPAGAACVQAPNEDDSLMQATASEGGMLFADVERAGDELYAIECRLGERSDTRAFDVGCQLSSLGGGSSGPTVPVEFVMVGETRFGFRSVSLGDLTVLPFAVGNVEDGGGAFAFLVDGSGMRVTPRLGRPPTSVDLDDPEHFALDVRRDDAGHIVFEHGIPSQTRRLRSVFDPSGHVVTFPASATLEAPPVVALDTTTERTRGQPSAVRLVTAGVASPIQGIDPAVATFGSDFVEVGGRVLVVFSEGTGHSTRIRAGLVDAATHSVVGGLVEVSDAGNEAGYATVDSYGGQTFVAWDEKVAGSWQVRVAPLVCR